MRCLDSTGTPIGGSERRIQAEQPVSLTVRRGEPRDAPQCPVISRVPTSPSLGWAAAMRVVARFDAAMHICARRSHMGNGECPLHELSSQLAKALLATWMERGADWYLHADLAHTLARLHPRRLLAIRAGKEFLCCAQLDEAPAPAVACACYVPLPARCTAELRVQTLSSLVQTTTQLSS